MTFERAMIFFGVFITFIAVFGAVMGSILLVAHPKPMAVSVPLSIFIVIWGLSLAIFSATALIQDRS